MARKYIPKRPRCVNCINLRAQRGLFWCRLGHIENYSYLEGATPRRPASRRVGWLQTPEGRNFSTQMGATCPSFEADDDGSNE